MTFYRITSIACAAFALGQIVCEGDPVYIMGNLIASLLSTATADIIMAIERKP